MKKKDKRGFTLLELIISLAIIGLILLGFFRVIHSTTKINEKNDRDIKGMNLAQSEVENLRSQIKSKGNTGCIEIENIINPHIENPKDGDINIEGIKIPLDEGSDGDIRWKDSDGEFILEIPDKYKDYTNQEEIVLKDKNNNDVTLERRRALIYKKKYSDNKYYKVKIVIKRKKAINNNDATKMYIYDISVYTSSDDSYFSKKEVDINNVVLLTGESSEGSGDGTNPPVDPPIDPPPIIPDSDNYLLYCLNKAASLFKQAGKNDLYNMIMVDKVVGNKTLIQMVDEESIDIYSCKGQLIKILEKIKKELENTNTNTQIDSINEAKYYCKVADHVLDYLKISSHTDLIEARKLAWSDIHGKIIASGKNTYAYYMSNLYDLLWSKGLSQDYSYFFRLLDSQTKIFNSKFSEINGMILSSMYNPGEVERKLILDKINKFIDDIIHHQVYDIEKYTRENIEFDNEVNNRKNNVLSILEEANRSLVHLKAIIYDANYYKNN